MLSNINLPELDLEQPIVPFIPTREITKLSIPENLDLPRIASDLKFEISLSDENMIPSPLPEIVSVPSTRAFSVGLTRPVSSPTRAVPVHSTVSASVTATENRSKATGPTQVPSKPIAETASKLIEESRLKLDEAASVPVSEDKAKKVEISIVSSIPVTEKSMLPINEEKEKNCLLVMENSKENSSKKIEVVGLWDQIQQFNLSNLRKVDKKPVVDVKDSR